MMLLGNILISLAHCHWNKKKMEELKMKKCLSILLSLLILFTNVMVLAESPAAFDEFTRPKLKLMVI